MFKSSFHSGQVSSSTFSFFKLQLFEIKCSVPVQCALSIYHPPKFYKNFVQDFADFVTGIDSFFCFCFLKLWVISIYSTRVL